MAKCSICGRPVVSEPHVVSTGQLIHDDCRSDAFRPREPPKVCGHFESLKAGIRASPVARRGPLGIFALEHRPVVLFVVGDEDTLMTYQALAQAANLDAELARDGHEAVLLAQLTRPDAIVLDLRDGHLDGRDIAGRLRADMLTRGLPVVLVGGALSGDVEADDFARASARKATDPMEVLRTIEGILHRSKGPAMAS